MKGMSKFGPGGIQLVFNPRDLDTPCMVYYADASATFDFALGEACLVGYDENYDLTAAQINWLRSYEAAAEEFATAVKMPADGPVGRNEFPEGSGG